MERGRSQAELVGLGMSAAYLSRLESGSREPTPRAVEYLAEALEVPVEAFEDLAGPNLADVLGMVFTTSDATRAAEARDLLTAALDGTPGADATTRWLALSELARLYNVLGDHERERDTLVEACAISDELKRPALQAQARLQLARCHRHLGDAAATRDTVREALRLGERHQFMVPPSDLTRARLMLVSAEAELGDIAEAARLSAEVCDGLTTDRGALAAEAYWTAATVATWQRDYPRAWTLIDAAMAAIDARDDMVLWIRIRLAAISLSLQASPPRTDEAQSLLDVVAPALALVGTARNRQEHLYLQAQLAYHRGELERAALLAKEALAAATSLMAFRDQVMLEALDGRIAMRLGERDALARLTALAERVTAMHMPEVAADIWRAIAMTATTDDTPAG